MASGLKGDARCAWKQKGEQGTAPQTSFWLLGSQELRMTKQVPREGRKRVPYTHTHTHTRTRTHTGMLCVLLSFVFSLSSFMGNNNRLVRCIFTNACPHGPFGRSLEFPPAARPGGREFFVSFVAVIVVVLAQFCIVPEKAGSSREVARKPQLLQVGHSVYNAVCQPVAGWLTVPGLQ